MEFYHDLITQKSWQLLQRLKKKYQFILIGGWAVFLYTRALKSKDIDLILEYSQLEKLKEEFPVTKNERLKKYEARNDGLEIDIYLPFYSNPGLPAEEVSRFTHSLEGFIVPQAEILALLKARALKERKNSVKGRKDLLDLVGLFRLDGFDFEKLNKLAKKYQLEDLVKITISELKNTTQIEELNLNSHQFSRLKKRILPQLS